MARVEYGDIITAMKGSIGGVTFQKNRAGEIARLKSGTYKNSTSKQVTQHALHYRIIKAWRDLSTDEQTDWNDFADLHTKTDLWGEENTLTGFNWFVSINNYRTMAGVPFLTTPPSYTLPTASPDYYLDINGSTIQLLTKTDVPSTGNIMIIRTTYAITNNSMNFRQMLRRTKVVATTPWTSIDITSEWESTHNLPYPPGTVNLNYQIGCCINTANITSGISGAGLFYIGGYNYDKRGIGYMRIGSTFIVR